MVLQLLEDGKPRRRDEIAYSLGEANQILNRMTASGLLVFNRTTQQYSIAKLGAQELEYSRGRESRDYDGLKGGNDRGMTQASVIEKKKSSAKRRTAYDELKEFQGRKYSGMKVGRSHKWIYDKGEWKEKKFSPDEWTFNYSAGKTRAWRAPEGSGAPVGTEYHWYIVADQVVKKLDANRYSTSMTGIKYKIAHKRSGQENWNIGERVRKRKLIQTLEKYVDQLKEEMNAPPPHAAQAA